VHRPGVIALLLLGATAAVLLLLAVVIEEESGDDAPPRAACAKPDAGAEQKLMDAYAQGSFPARQENARPGLPRSVSVEIPPIRFTGPGESSTLPVGPCQHIYRFVFPDVQAPPGGEASPFRYVEVDWNTEGLPRGPNNSFQSAHFDFHFYLRPAAEVNRATGCPVGENGVTCDPLRTDYAQMRRFLDLPDAGFVPTRYGPDPGSSIPEMGMHLLDATQEYTVDKVDHYPVLIYGTFAGDVYFAEASVTLKTLQDAMAAPGRTISFPFRQPDEVRGGLAWPTRFVIRQLPSGGFRAGFEGFRPGGEPR
jgi:hypothetical protein